MTTRLPRVSGYVQPDTHAKFSQLVAVSGRSAGQVLDAAIANLHVDREAWIAHQSGYQTMMALSPIAKMARKTLTDDELIEAMKAAREAAKSVFGPLGKRPFEVDIISPEDARQDAIFWAFIK
jgi:acetyl esterase/lipase